MCFWPEWRNLFGWVFFCDLHCVTRETGLKMINRQEGVIEVQRWDLIGHFGIMGTPRVTISQDDVMKPIRDNTLSVHQVTNSFQYSLKRRKLALIRKIYLSVCLSVIWVTNLKVVLLGFAPHDDVESLIRILCTSLDAVGHILLILIWIQPHAECSCVTSQLGFRIRTFSQTQRWLIQCRLYDQHYTISAAAYPVLKLVPPCIYNSLDPLRKAFHYI